MITPAFSAPGVICFRAFAQFSRPTRSSMPLRLPENVITFFQPSFAVASIASWIDFRQDSWFFGSQRPTARLCVLVIVQTRPYFLSVAKSFGVIRSMPTSPIRCAAEHSSSSEVLP
ncbi:MAG: hypothetical protein U0835_15835 [Isosphaeraceae bacterium]